MVVWIRTPKRCYRILDDFSPVFYLKACQKTLFKTETMYRRMGFQVELEEDKIAPCGESVEVQKITPDGLIDPRRYASGLDFFEGYEGSEFYNVDIPLDQRYLVSHDIRPFSLVERDKGWKEIEVDGIEYSLPPLKTATLEVESKGEGFPSLDRSIESIEVNEVELDGDEEDILEGLDILLKKEDPDIILTSDGDSFLMPYLTHRAETYDMKLVLGRAPSYHMPREGESYTSYGRVLYKAPTQFLKGRIHIDVKNSFMYREAGMDGLIEVSRLSKIPVQRLSRSSPGRAVDALETELALRDGMLVPWKRNFSERFKTMKHLLRSDRGGHIFEPRVGVHGETVKLDFSSMYPSMIVNYNLSPDTIDCRCEEGHEVPRLGYRVCKRKKGLIPRAIEPLILRRRAYKLMSDGEDAYHRRAKALKWLLVTCFGYTGYRKARFSNIEVHESITAYGRETLLDAANMAMAEGFQVIHGIVDSLWLQGDIEEIPRLINNIEDKVNVPLELEGVYDWVVFLPNARGVGVPNRYYGKLNGKMEAKGLYLKRHDTPSFFKSMQKEILERLCEFDEPQGLIDIQPQVRRYVEDMKTRVKRKGVPKEKLFFEKRVTKEIDDYVHDTLTKAALVRYRDKGVRIHPGQKIRYVVINRGSKNIADKVGIPGDGIEHYDTAFYVEYLDRVVDEVLRVF